MKLKNQRRYFLGAYGRRHIAVCYSGFSALVMVLQWLLQQAFRARGWRR